MLKILAVIIIFVFISRFVARFFLWRIIGNTMNKARFHAQSPNTTTYSQQKQSRGKDFDQIQDADFEDVTDPKED